MIGAATDSGLLLSNAFKRTLLPKLIQQTTLSIAESLLDALSQNRQTVPVEAVRCLSRMVAAGVLYKSTVIAVWIAAYSSLLVLEQRLFVAVLELLTACEAKLAGA